MVVRVTVLVNTQELVGSHAMRCKLGRSHDREFESIALLDKPVLR